MHNKITYSKPGKDKVKEKSPMLSNRAHLFTLLADTEFERLLYRVIKTEIEQGSWAKKFDEIEIMAATRDGARDCALFRRGKFSGVIQCKHSVSNTPLSVATFLPEVIKFVLYSFVFKEIVLFKGFEYFIATSGGIHETCNKLIRHFSRDIASQASLDEYAQRTIKKYRSLDTVDYASIRPQFIRRLQLLKVKGISSEDLSSLLSHAQNKGNEHAYFDTKYVVREESLVPIKKAIDSVEGKLDRVIEHIEGERPRPEPLAKVDSYLPRSYKQPEDPVYTFMKDERTGLLEIFGKQQYLIVLGWGLSGKSIELDQLAHELSSDQFDYHVFLRRIGDYSGQRLADFVPDIKLRPEDKVVLLLDGLDEVKFSYGEDILLNISSFKTDYPKARIVISCRTNYYEEFADSAAGGTLAGFSGAILKELDDDAIRLHLQGRKNFDMAKFKSKMEQADLEVFMRTPYYLVKFADRFQLTEEIYQNRSELFLDIIGDNVSLDVGKKHLKNTDALKSRSLALLKRLACVLEYAGTNTFTTGELTEVFSDQADIELIRDNGRSIVGSEKKGGNWRFFHHNVQEFLFAQFLSVQPLGAMLDFLTVDAAQEVLRQDTVHTVSFLIGMLKEGSAEHGAIKALLLNNEPAILVKIEPEFLDDQVRYDVFEGLTDYYRMYGRRIHRGKYDLGELGRFFGTEQIVDSIKSYLDGDLDPIEATNMLDILQHIDLDPFYGLHEELEETLLGLYARTADDGLKFNVMNNILVHVQYDSDGFHKVYDLLSREKDTHLKVLLLIGIFKYKLESKYEKYLLTQFEEMVKEEAGYFGNKGQRSRSGTESIVLNQCLGRMDGLEPVICKLGVLFRNLNALSHSISFRHQIEEILRQALPYDPEAKVFGMIDRIFVKGVTDGDINMERDWIWTAYFRGAGRTDDIFGTVVKKMGGLNYRTNRTLVRFSSAEAIEGLAKLVRAGCKGFTDPGAFQFFLWHKDKPLGVYFNKLISDKVDLDLPKVVDFEAHDRLLYQRKLLVLFDQGKFVGDIKRMAKLIGKPEMSYMDLTQVEHQEHWEGQYFFWLFDLLDHKMPRSGDRRYPVKELTVFARSAWGSRRFGWLYDVLRGKSSHLLSGRELEETSNWCHTVEPTLDFGKGLSYSLPRGEFCDEEMFIFFLIRLGIPVKRETTLLNMFQWYDDSKYGKGISDHVTENVALYKVKARIIRNLQDQKVTAATMKEHLRLLEKYKLKKGAKHLIPYLKKYDHYNWSEVLDCYLALDGDRVPLYGLLPTAKDENLRLLGHRLINLSDPKLAIYLKQLYADQPDRRHVIAPLLMRTGDAEVFAEFVDYAVSEKIVASDFKRIDEVRVTGFDDFYKPALVLYEYSFLPGANQGFYNSPRGIAVGVLRQLSLYHVQLKQACGDFLDELKSRGSAQLENIDYSLGSLLEDFEHQQLSARHTKISIAESVLKIYSLSAV